MGKIVPIVKGKKIAPGDVVPIALATLAKVRPEICEVVERCKAGEIVLMEDGFGVCVPLAEVPPAIGHLLAKNDVDLTIGGSRRWVVESVGDDLTVLAVDVGPRGHDGGE